MLGWSARRFDDDVIDLVETLKLAEGNLRDVREYLLSGHLFGARLEASNAKARVDKSLRRIDAAVRAR